MVDPPYQPPNPPHHPKHVHTHIPHIEIIKQGKPPLIEVKIPRDPTPEELERKFNKITRVYVRQLGLLVFVLNLVAVSYITFRVCDLIGWWFFMPPIFCVLLVPVFIAYFIEEIFFKSCTIILSWLIPKKKEAFRQWYAVLWERPYNWREPNLEQFTEAEKFGFWGILAGIIIFIFSEIF